MSEYHKIELSPTTVLRLLRLVAQLQAQLAHRDAHVEADDALRLHLEETVARYREALEAIRDYYDLAYREGEKAYQAVILATAALASDPETPPQKVNPEFPACPHASVTDGACDRCGVPVAQERR